MYHFNTPWTLGRQILANMESNTLGVFVNLEHTNVFTYIDLSNLSGWKDLDAKTNAINFTHNTPISTINNQSFSMIMHPTFFDDMNYTFINRRNEHFLSEIPIRENYTSMIMDILTMMVIRAFHNARPSTDNQSIAQPNSGIFLQSTALYSMSQLGPKYRVLECMGKQQYDNLSRTSPVFGFYSHADDNILIKVRYDANRGVASINDFCIPFGFTEIKKLQEPDPDFYQSLIDNCLNYLEEYIRMEDEKKNDTH